MSGCVTMENVKTDNFLKGIRYESVYLDASFTTMVTGSTSMGN